jgi:hypothetical protein
MKLWLALGASTLSLLLASPPLLADAPPPEALDCWGKGVGVACTNLSTHATGFCREGTCTSVKFDAAPITSACLTCEPGAPPAMDASCGTCDPGVPPADDSFCSIGKQNEMRRIGPWLLAGSFALLFLAGRRRRSTR